MIDYPNIDPVLLSIGPIKIRWYGIAYVIGILGGYSYIKYILNKYYPLHTINKDHISNGLTWLIIGIIIGGRLGHVIFYDIEYYINYPVQIVNTLQGGMSFHGGLIGVIVSAYFYSKKSKISLLKFFDCLAIATPIGLFFGRIANFINGELYGRVTSLPWGMVFPNGGPFPRHPSQIYEALLEGLSLFIILFIFAKNKALNVKGITSSIFLIMYGIFRFLVEFVREQESYVDYFYWGTTLGQWLTVPFIVIGFIMLYKSINRVKEEKNG